MDSIVTSSASNALKLSLRNKISTFHSYFTCWQVHWSIGLWLHWEDCKRPMNVDVSGFLSSHHLVLRCWFPDQKAGKLVCSWHFCGNWVASPDVTSCLDLKLFDWAGYNFVCISIQNNRLPARDAPSWRRRLGAVRQMSPYAHKYQHKRCYFPHCFALRVTVTKPSMASSLSLQLRAPSCPSKANTSEHGGPGGIQLPAAHCFSLSGAILLPSCGQNM